MKKFFIHTILVLAGMSFLSCDDISGSFFSSPKGIEQMQSLTVEELPVEITDHEFYDLYTNTVTNALNKISLMQNSGLKRLGEETQYGDISGTIHYNATFSIWKRKATVIITFENYCDTTTEDQGIMILDDSFTTLANTNGDGQLTGTINISGFYPGYVDHDLEILSEEKSGGNYTIYQEGSESETLIPWDYLAE